LYQTLGDIQSLCLQNINFRTFGEGVEAITAALMAPDSERMLISDSVKRFSIDSFITRFQEIIKNIISSKIKP
jgi:hypothetical protein